MGWINNEVDKQWVGLTTTNIEQMVDRKWLEIARRRQRTESMT